jgi:hypothetical protein
MYRCRRPRENVGFAIAAVVILAILIMPIVGGYLAFFGEDEKQTKIGWGLLIFYFIARLFT